MDDHSPAMLRLISSAVKISTAAGHEIRRILLTGKLDVIDKGLQDFQTEADRVVQRMIVASLSKRFPQCIIVGEEDLVDDEEADRRLVIDAFDDEVMKIDLPQQYKDVKESDITIWVDPLDGTTEFVKGYLEHVTILIGISVGGRSVAGIIHQPFDEYVTSKSVCTGRTMWGVVGLGCFGGLVSRKIPGDNLFIVATTASHGNRNIEDSIAALKPDQVLKVGGAGFKVLLVIEGHAHSYVFTSNGCKRWDTCAPEAVLKSLGGNLTDVFGNEIDYSHRADNDYQNYLGVVASKDPETHKKVIEKIPMDVKNRLMEHQSQKAKPNKL